MHMSWWWPHHCITLIHWIGSATQVRLYIQLHCKVGGRCCPSQGNIASEIACMEQFSYFLDSHSPTASTWMARTSTATSVTMLTRPSSAAFHIFQEISFYGFTSQHIQRGVATHVAPPTLMWGNSCFQMTTSASYLEKILMLSCSFQRLNL